MKQSEIREAYEELSGSLSKYNRQLAFAGIGIVWLFRITDKRNVSIEPEMLVPIMCFVISFAFDLLQYLWQSLAWYVFYWYNRQYKGLKETDEANEPEWPNVIAWAMFVIKVIALMVAYIRLGIYLCNLLIRV